MPAHINFAKTEFKNIIDEITVKTNPSHQTNEYIGSDGSNTTFVSDSGRVITFKMIIPAYAENEDGPKISNYLSLYRTYKKKTGVLTSQSHLNLKGNYMFTEFNVTEDAGNNFECSCEFTEVKKFNATKKTFRVWGNVSSKNKKTIKPIKPFEFKSKLDHNLRILLLQCNVLTGLNPNKSFICVKRLQKFLQKEGYYTKFPIDGKLGKQTTAAIQQLQTAILATSPKTVKLKANGLWDKYTVAYVRHKYLIMTKKELIAKYGKTKVIPGGEIKDYNGGKIVTDVQPGGPVNDYNGGKIIWR